MFNMKKNSCGIWKKDHYMSMEQLDYFRRKLLKLRAELENSTRQSLLKMTKTNSRPIKEMERSALSFDRDIQIQTQIRNRDLIRRIDQALEQINDGTYGYCKETEEPYRY